MNAKILSEEIKLEEKVHERMRTTLKPENCDKSVRIAYRLSSILTNITEQPNNEPSIPTKRDPPPRDQKHTVLLQEWIVNSDRKKWEHEKLKLEQLTASLKEEISNLQALHMETQRKRDILTLELAENLATSNSSLKCEPQQELRTGTSELERNTAELVALGGQTSDGFA